MACDNKPEDWITGSNVQIEPAYRHIDVDLYYKLGELDKAQAIARELRPFKIEIGEISDDELRRVRNAFKRLL